MNTVLLAAVCDAPWLLLVAPTFQKIVKDIQGDRALVLRYWAAIPIYIAIAVLVSRVYSVRDAFITGLCAYAIYDFTQIFALDRYPVWFGLADTLWGGCLFAIVWSITGSDRANN